MKRKREKLEKEIILSIIIPIYNIEKYIEKCLESILLCQSDKIEIICINDGSSDNSLEIAQKQAKKDPRVFVFTQKNAGLSAARNVGLKKAQGEYITFIDGDDFVKSDLFGKLLIDIEAHSMIDVFVTDFNRIKVLEGKIYEEHIYQIGHTNSFVIGMDFLPKMLRHKQCFWNVWRYVYKRQFLESHNLLFKENFLCEDIDFTTKVFLCLPQIAFAHCPYYCYRTSREHSIMGCTSLKRIMDLVFVLSESIIMTEKSSFIYKQIFIEQYQFELFLSLAQIWEISKSEKEIAQRFIQNSLHILLLGKNCFSHMSYYAISKLGISTISFLLHLLKIQKHLLKGWKIKAWKMLKMN